MKRYAYVIIENEAENLSTICTGCSDLEVNIEEVNRDADALDVLLKTGWVPLRESAMSAQSKTSSSCVLVLLVRE
jgi:hypothetical protein